MKFEINLKNLSLGLLALFMFACGLYVFMSVMTGKFIFVDNPRQNRAIFIIISWILIAGSFVVVAPNKSGLTIAIPLLIGLYLSCAFYLGTFMVFSVAGTEWIEIAIAAGRLIPTMFFFILIVMLVYNAVSGQEFFRTLIFGAAGIALIAIGIFLNLLPTA